MCNRYCIQYWSASFGTAFDNVQCENAEKYVVPQEPLDRFEIRFHRCTWRTIAHSFVSIKNLRLSLSHLVYVNGVCVCGVCMWLCVCLCAYVFAFVHEWDTHSCFIPLLLSSLGKVILSYCFQEIMPGAMIKNILRENVSLKISALQVGSVNRIYN